MRLFHILCRWLTMAEDNGGWTEADLQRAEEDADAAAIAASWHRRSIPGVTDPTTEDARWPLAVRKRQRACEGE